MLTAKAQFGFFVVLTVAAFVLFFFIIEPYITALFMAVILAIIFSPLHGRMITVFKGWNNVASLASTFIVLIIIVTPIFIFGSLLFQEARDLGQGFSLEPIQEFLGGVEVYLADTFGLEFELSQRFEVESIVEQGAKAVVDYFDTIFAATLKIGLGSFLMVLALFYLFRDGGRAMVRIRELSPLRPEYTRTILSKMEGAINAVVRGRLLVGLIQGFVIGTGFFLFQLPNPVLWGIIAAVASMLPVVGPMFIVLPTVAILLFVGAPIWQWVGILSWGVMAVIIVDEYLGSVLIDQRMKIHPILVLISVLGGIGLFGPIGFVAGPVALSVLFALIEIYPLITSKEAYEDAV